MFKSIKDTLDKGVAAVSVKSESIVESSRVRTAIATAQKTMDQELSALGVKCYNSWLSGGTDQEELEAACQKIKAIQIGLTGLKDRLEQIKEEESQILGSQKKAAPSGDMIFCVNCGKKLPADARFCDACGTPVKS